jgi:hypothetical protein
MLATVRPGVYYGSQVSCPIFWRDPSNRDGKISRDSPANSRKNSRSRLIDLTTEKNGVRPVVVGKSYRIRGEFLDW